MRFLPLLPLLLAASIPVSCVSTDQDPGPSPSPAGNAKTSITLSDADAAAIGRKIWQNECNGTVEGLTSWNAGEDFPSLGIGHFIWYVPGRPGPFDESFPRLVQYMQKEGLAVPKWVATAKGAPWNSRSEFLNQQNSPRMKELRTFLANSVPTQTGFIVQRLEEALPKMKAATSGSADKQRLEANFYKVASTRSGVYSLIDYVNFKGEGVKAEEKYNGQGWGLRDVLLGMKDTPGGQASVNEYSESAKRVLTRRIANSPSARGESRWSAGWMSRCEGYKRGI